MPVSRAKSAKHYSRCLFINIKLGKKELFEACPSSSFPLHSKFPESEFTARAQLHHQGLHLHAQNLQPVSESGLTCIICRRIDSCSSLAWLTRAHFFFGSSRFRENTSKSGFFFLVFFSVLPYGNFAQCKCICAHCPSNRSDAPHSQRRCDTF